MVGLVTAVIIKHLIYINIYNFPIFFNNPIRNMNNFNFYLISALVHQKDYEFQSKKKETLSGMK